MGCCELEKILIHDDNPNRVTVIVNKITCFFILTILRLLYAKVGYFFTLPKIRMFLLGKYCCELAIISEVEALCI